MNGLDVIGVFIIGIALPLLLRVAVLVVATFVGWRILKPRWAFTIVVNESGVLSHTGIKTAQQQRLLEMFKKTRFVEGKGTIRGRNNINVRLQLGFFGEISDECQQQIRNFVVNEL